MGKHVLLTFQDPSRNFPMQNTENFFSSKNWKKFFVNLDMFAQDIDCGYTLEPPRQGGSNEYPQSMFWNKNKKNGYTL